MSLLCQLSVNPLDEPNTSPTYTRSLLGDRCNLYGDGVYRLSRLAWDPTTNTAVAAIIPKINAGAVSHTLEKNGSAVESSKFSIMFSMSLRSITTLSRLANNAFVPTGSVFGVAIASKCYLKAGQLSGFEDIQEELSGMVFFEKEKRFLTGGRFKPSPENIFDVSISNIRACSLAVRTRNLIWFLWALCQYTAPAMW